MLAATPWKLRWVEVLSWQDGPHARLETAAWPATDSTGELAILKPPVTKLDAWQAEHTALAVGIWLDAGATVVTPYHIALAAAWQLSQVWLETAAWPAAASDGAVAILKPPVTKFDVWQVLQPPVPSAMWLAAPVVPTVPGGTTIVTPNHAMPELWQVWQVNDDTAVWPAADSAGVVLIWKPVPVIASAVAWQALHSAEETGMWLPAPGVPTVPGCCFGCPPMPWLVPENGPLPGPWHALQASEATDEWTIFDVDGFLGCPAAWHTVQAGCADGSGTWLLGRLLPLNGGVVLWQFVQSLGEASGATAWAAPGRT